MVEQFHQGVKGPQKQAFQLPIDMDRMFFQDFEKVFNPVGGLLDALEFQHARAPLDRVGRPKDLIHQLRVFDRPLQVHEALLDGCEVVLGFLNEITDDALLLILHGT